MSAVLLNPTLLARRNDPFGTGVVHLPLGLAYVAGALRQAGLPVSVLDAYGLAPFQTRIDGDLLFFGLRPTEVVQRIGPDSSLALLYAGQRANVQSVLDLLREVKVAYPRLPVVVLENAHALTPFALEPLARQLLDSGADFILTGEAEETACRLACALDGQDGEPVRQIPGLIGRGFRNAPGKAPDPDALAWPAWDLFPLKNYWSVRHAHGPLSAPRYLPLLTSRGGSHPRASGATRQRWRPRAVLDVVDEMEHLGRAFGVREFHLEDLDPAVNEDRMLAFCEEILKRQLRVVWKITCGARVEPIRSEGTIDRMAEAGCRYISVALASWSEKATRERGSPSYPEHAVKLLRRMGQVGIRSQACLALGSAGETDADRAATESLVRHLAQVGVDEVGLFLACAESGPELLGLRRELYRKFLTWKVRAHPWKVVRQTLNVLRRRFETRTEMAPYRAGMYRWLDYRAARAAPQVPPEAEVVAEEGGERRAA